MDLTWLSKGNNRVKSGIGKSRSLRLDSSPVRSRGLSWRQICLRQNFSAIDHRTRFIRLAFGTLVEP